MKKSNKSKRNTHEQQEHRPETDLQKGPPEGGDPEEEPKTQDVEENDEVPEEEVPTRKGKESEDSDDDSDHEEEDSSTSFFKKKGGGVPLLPPPEKIWTADLSTLNIPELNLDEKADPITVLTFVHKMSRFENVEDETVRGRVLQYALKGKREKEWAQELDYDLGAVMAKIVEHVKKSEQWVDTKSQLEKGQPMGLTVKSHIFNFKLVASHIPLDPEDKKTKLLFAKALAPKIIQPSDIRKGTDEYWEFCEIEKMALENAELLGIEKMEIVKPPSEPVSAAVTRDELSDDEDLSDDPTSAAAVSQRKKKRAFRVKGHRSQGFPFKPRNANIRCYNCGGFGHIAANCPSTTLPYHPNSSRGAGSKKKYACACSVTKGRRKLTIRRNVRVGGNNFTALLDSGAKINIVSREAASYMQGKRIYSDEVIRCVGKGGVLDIDQAIKCRIHIGNIKAQVKLYVVPDSPVDILLGEPFLMKYSRGFRMMCKEFLEKEPEKEEQSEPLHAGAVQGAPELTKLLDNYPDLILEPDEMPDPNRVYKGQTFRLGLPEDKRDRIYYKPQYPPDPSKIDIYRKLIIPLIKAGVYVPSKSPHNNPVMLVPKKKPGDYRLVVDNRLVNAECRAEGTMSAAPLGVIKAIRGATIFTTLDCKNAFYSLPLDKRDRQFTAIMVPTVGKLELTRMPMGAKASSAALYRAMVDTLGKTLYKYTLVWADDIIIYSKNMEEHIKHVDDVLKRLDANGFSISKDKIVLGRPEVQWLGYTISAKGVRPNMDKIKELSAMRRPQNIKELRSALGMWTYFASFVPRYSIIASPLNAQLRNNNKVLKWSEECQKAWEEIKKTLIKAPILGFPDYTKPFELHTDACKNGFAAVLTQRRGNRHVLIDAMSRTTTAAERNYSSAKLECACVIWAAKKWKHYLYAVPVTHIVTDSYGLQYLDQGNTQSALVQRWLLEMEGFRYTVRYHKGAENIADFLSRQQDFAIAAANTRARRNNPRRDYAALNKGIWKQKDDDKTPNDSSKNQQRRKIRIVRQGNQRKQLTIIRPGESAQSKEVIELIEKQQQDSSIQRLWDIAQGRKVYQMTEQENQDAKNLSMVDGVIVKSEHQQGGGIIKRIVVPLSMQEEIIQKIHEQGHAGVTGTLNTVKQHHWFRGMKVTVKNVVRKCQDCIKRKGRPLTKEKLAPDQRPRVLGGRWHIDGVLLPQSGEYDHLMVATDVATKYVIIKEARGETADAAKDILMEIIRRFGRPQEITTDRGRAFISEQFLKICEGLFIRYKPTGAGQPQADGMVERVNKTIEDALAIACGGDSSTWADHVAEIEYAINTRVSSVTKFSPYELVYGRLPPGPVYTDVLTQDEERAAGEKIRCLRNRINALQQIAHENQMRAAGSQQKFHDAHAEAHTFKVGDTVFYYKPSDVERGVTTKLAYKWSGPFKIRKVIGDVTYILEGEDHKALPGTIHARHLYKPPAPEGKDKRARRRRRR